MKSLKIRLAFHPHNTRFGNVPNYYFDIYRFKDDGRPYMPAYPPPPVPPPPSYETVMAGAYPAQDPLQPVVLESDTNHMFLWSPGPELERSKEYNNDISRRSYQLAGVPTSPRLSGEISADIPPPPVLPLNNLNSIYHIDSNV